eukprot:1157805-Pelagomonas_calceolata.AAC.3
MHNPCWIPADCKLFIEGKHSAFSVEPREIHVQPGETVIAKVSVCMDDTRVDGCPCAHMGNMRVSWGAGSALMRMDDTSMSVYAAKAPVWKGSAQTEHLCVLPTCGRPGGCVSVHPLQGCVEHPVHVSRLQHRRSHGCRSSLGVQLSRGYLAGSITRNGCRTAYLEERGAGVPVHTCPCTSDASNAPLLTLRPYC